MDKLREVLRGEAEEYFEHNPKCKGVKFFIVDNNEFDDGEACVYDYDALYTKMRS